MKIRRYELLKASVDAVSREQFMTSVCSVMKDQRERRLPFLIFAVNPEKVILAERDRQLREVLKMAGLLIPDGVGIVWACMYLYHVKLKRLTGVDTFLFLLGLAEKESWRVFFLGGKGSIQEALKKRLKEKYPSLTISGLQHGYFEREQTAAVIERINQGTDLLFVAFGSPSQEKWLLQHQQKLNAKLCMGVGGSFDVLAGNVKRAPTCFQKCGMEWFYRLLCEPKRIFRQWKLVLFVFKILISKFQLPSSRKVSS